MLSVLEAPLDHIDRAWRELEAKLNRFNSDQQGFRPGEGWTIHEVVHHMHLVESAFANAMMASGNRGPRRRTMRRHFGYAAVRFVLTRGIRVRMPRKVAGEVRPAADVDLSEIYRRGQVTRAELRLYLEDIEPDDLPRSAAKHPVAGPLNFRESLWFIEAHFQHHLRQIARVENHPDFPRSS